MSLIVNHLSACEEGEHLKRSGGKIPKSEFSLPTKMSGLIDYQEGSVVSRTIIDKKAGTVTLFAFDETESLSEHTAPYDALIQIIDGEANVTIGGKSSIVKAGEMVVIPANAPHSLKATKRFKMLLVMVRS
jgi:quercetin dioxygenase-like cupin family protein